jgi:hypothetical protein
MEVGQGPNWGCSAKGKNICVGDGSQSDLTLNNNFDMIHQRRTGQWGYVLSKCAEAYDEM